jgi:D-alanine-D-alanine ligase
MRIGITYDLKPDTPPSPDTPDDLHEEFDSPATIEAIAAVLRSMGHIVDLLGDGRPMLQRLLADPPDLVFNFAEGQGVGRGREARVPAVLELLDIPHTGSDILTLAATLDKVAAKRLVADAIHFKIPEGRAFAPGDSIAPEGLPFPLILKPAWEGSSKGIRSRCLVESPDDLMEIVEELRRVYRQPILAEQFIEGDELTVGVVGNAPPHVIGVLRVMPLRPTSRFVYGLEVKRDYQCQVHYECPPPYPPDQLDAISKAALEAYRLLGCRDVARIDFRLAADGLYFLEANPLPGLNPESSDLCILARLAGWTYERLIAAIVQAALARLGLDEA